MSRPRFDFAHGAEADPGARAYQEDSLQIWRPNGSVKGASRPLLVVLSDGMGGHVSGEVASRLVCDRYVKSFSSEHGTVEQLLEHSLVVSNDAISNEVRKNGALKGMGCTLVAGYVDQDGLRWVSVGDSALLLWRAGTLTRLNEDHSLGALLDKQAAANLISAEDARNDPRRRTLRSALTGNPIAVQEIEPAPHALQHGDWVLLASDGLETLNGNEIARIVGQQRENEPSVLVRALIDEVRKRKAPHQDNVSIVAVKVTDPMQAATRILRSSRDVASQSSGETTITLGNGKGPAVNGMTNVAPGPLSENVQSPGKGPSPIVLAAAATLLGAIAIVYYWSISRPTPPIDDPKKTEIHLPPPPKLPLERPKQRPPQEKSGGVATGAPTGAAKTGESGTGAGGSPAPAKPVPQKPEAAPEKTTPPPGG